MTFTRPVLSPLLAGLLLAGAGCSTLKKDSAPASGTASPAPAATTADATPAQATAVALGAAVSSEGLTAANLENARRAAQAGLGQGQNLLQFAYDSDALSDAAVALLRRHVEFMKANPGSSARLEGHTDERGTYEYNVALGERRGQVVAAFLRTHGIEARRLEVVSYGELKPVSSGHDEDAWAANRRVEIVYL